jgi:hypothetical protein
MFLDMGDLRVGDSQQAGEHPVMCGTVPTIIQKDNRVFQVLADTRLAPRFHATSVPFNSFRRNELPIRVRFDAQSTRMQKTTAPDRNATRRARNSGQLFFGQVSDFHPERMP